MCSKFVCSKREFIFVGWEREFELPWREDGPPNHHIDDKVDLDRQVVNKELSFCWQETNVEIYSLG